jgi:hypothetical protein
MCDPVIRTASSGAVRRLCNKTEKALKHLLKEYLPQVELRPSADGTEAPSSKSTSGNESDAPSERAPQTVLKAFLASATYVVAESQYYDIDYRSEFAVTLPKSFRTPTYEVTRLHFFSGGPYESPASLRDFIRSRQASDYLGYMVIRPQAYGTVGRSIVPPHLTSGILKNPADQNSLIRTVVSEPIQLFGVPLMAVGVPFMEQDGHLIRCAHVSAWITHYTAYLRGVVPRRTTGMFHLLGAEAESVGRTYPSIGLSAATLNKVLRQAGLPPEILESAYFSEPRLLTWADRPEMVEEESKLKNAVAAAQAELDALPTPTRIEEEYALHMAERKLERVSNEYSRFWVREKFATSVCRYLNSSIPSIVVRKTQEHTQVTIGYIRNSDRIKSAESSSSPSAVTAVIVSDDPDGPFEVVELDELAQEILDEATLLLTPLPKSIWLSGEAAERAAIVWFTELTTEAVGVVAKATPDDEDLIGLLADFYEGVGGEGGTKYTVRSYLIDSVNFKIDIAERLAQDPRTVDAICEIQMPKYIWVCEVVDRNLRSSATSTIACIALDATMAEVDGDVPLDVYPLFVQIPGLMRIFNLLGQDSGETAWFPSLRGPYLAGQWHESSHGVYGQRYMRYQFKLASANE